MGRNAKFYKSSKDKKKRSSVQSRDGNDSTLYSGTSQIMKIKPSRGDGQVSKEGVEVQVDQQTIPVQSMQRFSKADKLKSKLWNELEAKRSQEGKKKYATPKEAGIDYIRQWEKKGR